MALGYKFGTGDEDEFLGSGANDVFGAPLHSDLTGVGDDAVLGTLGTRWYFAPQWSVDSSVVEDIRVETAPDVTFQASLSYRPGS